MSGAASWARLWLPALSLAEREFKHFLRAPGRVVGALGTPVVFWLLLGSGIGGSFTSSALGGSENYLEYFFPGTLTLILLFTAIFSMVSLIRERDEGFLQGVLVAPVSRGSVVFGKVFGCAGIAAVQGLVFLALAPLAGLPLDLGRTLLLVAVTFLVASGMASLGFVFAWRSESVQGFHSVMNLVLLPLWLLSGAVFPASGASGWLRVVLAVNPLTYGVAALRRLLVVSAPEATAGVPSLGVSVAVIAGFSLVLFVAGTVLVRRSPSGTRHLA